MIFGFENIEKYIPQRKPMIMVDRLIEHHQQYTLSGLLIASDNVFVSNEVFSEAGLLENMAQTAALSKGYETVESDLEPPLGFIGAVKNFQVFSLPKVDDHLQTSIKVKHEVLNASIVDAEVSCGDQVIASCELKIFLNPQINHS